MNDSKMVWLGRRNSIDYFLAGATLMAHLPGVGWCIFQSQEIGATDTVDDPNANKSNFASMFVLNKSVEPWLAICSKTGILTTDKFVSTETEWPHGRAMA